MDAAKELWQARSGPQQNWAFRTNIFWRNTLVSAEPKAAQQPESAVVVVTSPAASRNPPPAVWRLCWDPEEILGCKSSCRGFSSHFYQLRPNTNKQPNVLRIEQTKPSADFKHLSSRNKNIFWKGSENRRQRSENPRISHFILKETESTNRKLKLRNSVFRDKWIINNLMRATRVQIRTSMRNCWGELSAGQSDC